MDRNTAFLKLARAAAACTRCPELAERSAVLGPGNGALKPLAMFVAEAPGRQGADRTRTPLVGDQSGTNFDKLITAVGITRDNIFITNAALCNPRSASGANRKPRQTEIAKPHNTQ